MSAARTQAAAARTAWNAHLQLCWQCHAAGRRPGLFCDAGFDLAQALTRALFEVAAARGCPDQAQGRLL